MGYWEIYGSTMETAVANARLVRRIAYGVIGALLYWRFAAAIPTKRLLHVVALYVLVQLIDLCVSLLLGTSVQDWFDPWFLGRSLLAAAVGFTVAGLGSNNSFKPKPLRGSA